MVSVAVITPAGVMELADVLDSKSSGSDTVPVRPRSPAPDTKNPNFFQNGEEFGFFIFHEKSECTN